MKKVVKILLVENDKNLGYILKSYLTVKGYPTVLCLDGNEALERFENEAFDFVISSVVLRNIDGFTLAEKIKKCDNEIPLVFLTSKSSRNDVSKGFEIGADDYIIKPFSMDELLDRIKAICRRTVLRTKNEHVFQLASYTFDRKKLIFKFIADERVDFRELAKVLAAKYLCFNHLLKFC